MTIFKVITQTVKTNRGEYVLVEIIHDDSNDVSYGTVDKKYIKNGKTTKGLNGFELCRESTVGGALDRRIRHDEVDDLIDAGMEDFEAITRVNGKKYGWTEEQIEEAIAKIREGLK